MRVQWNESTMKSKRLRRNAPWLCLATCICVLGLTARLEERKTFAQASPLLRHYISLVECGVLPMGACLI